MVEAMEGVYEAVGGGRGLCAGRRRGIYAGRSPDKLWPKSVGELVVVRARAAE